MLYPQDPIFEYNCICFKFKEVERVYDPAYDFVVGVMERGLN